MKKETFFGLAMLSLAGCSTTSQQTAALDVQPLELESLKPEKIQPVKRVFAGNPARNRLIADGKKLIGTRYRYGGTSPSTGFDCSGYVGYVYKKVGKTLPRTSRQMAESVGRISTKSARVGDLVFFYSGGRVYHVAIYAGDGYVWHAPGTGERVKLEKIWTTSVTFGRV